MADKYVNFGYAVVTTAPSPASSGTNLSVGNGQAALLPALPVDCTVWPANQQPLNDNAEIVTVTAIAGDTLTITRGAQNTTPIDIKVNYQLAATVNKKTMDDIDTDIDSRVPKTTKVNGHALSGDVTVSKSDVGLGNVTNDAQVKKTDVDTSTNLGTSDTKVPSQKAVKTYVDSAGSVLPDMTGHDGQFLGTNGTEASWQNVSGAGIGNVTGPTSGSTDNAIARYDATTGTKLLDSGAILDDNGNLSLPTGASLTADEVDTAAIESTGDMSISATGNATLSGVDITIDGSGTTTINGTLIKPGGDIDANGKEIYNIKPSVNAQNAPATLAPDASRYGQYSVNNLNAAMTINAPTNGVDGSKVLLRIKDNGTTRALTWDNNLVPIGVTLPSDTPAGKVLYVGMVYSNYRTAWEVIAVVHEE